MHTLEDARYHHKLWSEREMIVTSVSPCGLQRQSNKDTGWPNEALISTIHILNT